MKRAKRINRRTFLGGAGAALALPMLESMLPIGKTAFAQENSAKRMLGYYVPNGFHMPSFTPGATGRNFDLSATLSPLANVKDDLLILSNTENYPANPDGPGDHAAGTGSFLTATHVFKTEGADIRNGISVDQVAANQLEGETRYKSLELGMDGGGSAGGCDSGYSCAYARNIAWAGPQTPLPKTVNPRTVFDRVFAGFDSQANAEESARRRRLQKSVLDYVRSDATRLQARLGATDRAKMEEYLTGVRELERRIDGLDEATVCGVPDRPGENYNVTEKAQIMADLITLSFQCDLTRVQTFMLANAGSGRSYNFLGISEGHHQISHHQGLQSNHAKLEQINRWEMEQFAYLLERMKNTQDVDGTPLLDTCTVFMSSEISDGNRHNHDDLPVILAGNCRGYFDTGRHVRFAEKTKISEVFMTMLDAVGTPVQEFGDDGQNILSI